MDLEAALQTSATPAAVVVFVAELDTYPQWMSLVHSARRLEASEPTWDVELRAKVGPFARSKRLRMVRSEFVEGGRTRIVFDRREVDGRQHAAWRLTITVWSEGTTTHLTMHLHYDGRFFAGVVESILQHEIDAGRTRLAGLLGD